MEKTFRKNGKWAKVSGQRGRWACAQGWQGVYSANKMLIWPTKDGALICARGWVNDK